MWIKVSIAGGICIAAAGVWSLIIWLYRRPAWVASPRGTVSRGWEEIAVRVIIQNFGLRPIYLSKEGHTVAFPSKKGGEKRVGISVIALDRTSADPITVPPFGSVEVGTDVFKPLITMVTGKGLENEPYFEVRFKDEWNRQTTVTYLLPDTLVKAVPNPETGTWEYPANESLTLSAKPFPRESRWLRWLDRRAAKHVSNDNSVGLIWPEFTEDPNPAEAPKYTVSPPVNERDSVVAFVDILGFKQLMQSTDKERRNAAINLLERLVENSSNHGIEVRDLGLGHQIFKHPEVSTFSDNVVLSIPICGVSKPSSDREIREPASAFMTNLITRCISTFWQGLHLGILFRGGISLERLYHAANVVAGDGLVKAVELESQTKLPRIAVDPAVLEATDNEGQPIISDEVRHLIAQDPDDGTYHLDTMMFHIGVWWDYFYFKTGEPKINWNEVRAALREIQCRTETTIEELEQKANEATGKESEELGKAIEKWRWFKQRFEEAQGREDWAHVWNTSGKPIIHTD